MKSEKWPESLITEICHVIEQERVGKGYSIYELSQRSGVSQQGIGYYEKLERRPNIDCLARIARALDMTLSELIAMAEKGIK